LTLSDFKPGALAGLTAKGVGGAAGPQGQPGAQGPPGAAGVPGQPGLSDLSYRIKQAVADPATIDEGDPNDPNDDSLIPTDTEVIASCPSGMSPTGGGIAPLSFSLFPGISIPWDDDSDADAIPDNAWLVTVANTSLQEQEVFAYAVCTSASDVSSGSSP
jgi:hypothetical protein